MQSDWVTDHTRGQWTVNLADLIVEEVSGPAERRARPPPAIVAIAEAVENRVALNLDCAFAA